MAGAPPKRRDARFIQIAVLILYTIAARALFNFERPHFVTAVCVASAAGLDMLIGKLYFKKIVPPWSAIIIGLSSSILVDVRTWPYFLVVVAASVLSKAFITYRGKHFFNPTNFGVVLALQLFPNDVAGIPHLFNGYLWPSVIFTILGLATVIYARLEAVSLSWMAGFLLFAIYRTYAGGNAYVAFGPAMSSAFLLFTFHMISDPATTPRTAKYQIAFGIFTALLDAILRLYQVHHGTFYALFVASGLLCWIRTIEERAAQPSRVRLAVGTG